MIRASIVWRIFCRELKDSFRDWNTICMIFVLPLLLWPVMGVVQSEIYAAKKEETQKSEKEDSLKNPPKVVVLSEDTETVNRLKENGFKILAVFPEMQISDIQTQQKFISSPKWSNEWSALRHQINERIKSNEVDAVILQETKAVPEKSYANRRMVIVNDMTVPRSKKAGVLLKSAMEKWDGETKDARLKSIGETKALVTPLRWEIVEISPNIKVITFHAGYLVPFMLLLLLIAGCHWSALQAIPREKEHNTLSKLLAAPILPIELLLGKWMNVMLVGAMNALMNVASLCVMLWLAIHSAFGKGSLEMMAINGWAFSGLLLADLVSVTMIISATALLICLFAKSHSDGNYLIVPLMAIFGIPAAIAAMESFKLTTTLSLVPAVNNAVMLRELLQQGTVPLHLFALTICSSALFAMLILLFASCIFQFESVRFNSANGWKEVFQRKTLATGNAPLSMVVFLIVLGSAFYVGVLAMSLNIKAVIFLTQASLLLVIALVLWYFHLPWRDTLSLHRSKITVIMGAILVGLSAWAVALPLSWLLTPPESWSEIFYRALMPILDEKGGALYLFLLVAILPAICEELVFRGFIQGGLMRNFRPSVAITLTAICFGLIHYSLYKFLPTMALGWVCGWVAWRAKSILPSMLIHALNNSLVVIALIFTKDSAGQKQVDSPGLPLITVVAIVFIGGILWIYRATKNSPAKNPISA